jgi:hypothetical protein
MTSFITDCFEIYNKYKKCLSFDDRLILLQNFYSCLKNHSVNGKILIDFYIDIKDNILLVNIFKQIIVKYINENHIFMLAQLGDETLFLKSIQLIPVGQPFIFNDDRFFVEPLIENCLIGGNINILRIIMDKFNIRTIKNTFREFFVLTNLIKQNKYELFLQYEEQWDMKSRIADDLTSESSYLLEPYEFNKISEYLMDNYKLSKKVKEKMFVNSFYGKNIKRTEILEKDVDIDNMMISSYYRTKIFAGICKNDSIEHFEYVLKHHFWDINMSKIFELGAFNIYLKIKESELEKDLNFHRFLVFTSKNYRMMKYIINHTASGKEYFDFIFQENVFIKNSILEIFNESDKKNEEKNRKLSLLLGIYYGIDHTKSIDEQLFGIMGVENLFETLNYL